MGFTVKTLWEKEKMLVTSIFSFSHSFFQSLLLQIRYQSELRGKEILSTFDLFQYHGMETLYGKFLRCIQDGGHVLLTK